MGRGINRGVLAADRLEHRDAKPLLYPGRLQQVRRAAPAVAEGAIPADNNMARADRRDDYIRDEVLGTLGGKAEIEMLDEQQLDAKSCQFALFDAKRRQ